MPDRPTTTEERVAAAARQAVAAALRADREEAHLRRRFTIDKFGRHRDGYLHARIIVDGERRAYFTLQFGSWLAPGNEGKLKEPEGLLGSDLGRAVKYALSDQARRFLPTPPEETSDGDSDEHSDEPSAAGRASATVPAAGLPGGGDQGSSPE